MRKIIGLILIVAVAGILVGCETTTPEIKSTFPQPEGLSIRGVVYGTKLDQDSDEPGDLVSGAMVTLNGDRQTWTTSTDANGEYSFTGLPQSSNQEPYIITVTKNGYQRRINTSVNLDNDDILPDNSVAVVDIILDNDPVVLNISPAPGTVVDAAALTLTVEFNEAMDQSSVRPSFTAQGIRAYAIADTQTLTTSWSADSKILYITTGNLLPNQVYRLQVDPGDYAKDQAGYLLDETGGTSGNAGGLPDDVYNTTSSEYNYRTASGGVPGNPTDLLLSVDGNAQGDMDYAEAVIGGNDMNLSWLAPTSGQVTGYRVYVATSSTGPWMLLGNTEINTFSRTMTNINNALYGDTYNPECLDKLAFVTDTVHVKVCAWNAEGESDGVTTSERDGVEPGVITPCHQNPANMGIPAFVDVAASLTNYSTGANLDMGCYLTFTEPMDVSTLEDNQMYDTFLSLIEVTSAKVVYNSDGFTVVELQFASAYGVGAPVYVSVSGPEDLSGNTVDAANYISTIAL